MCANRNPLDYWHVCGEDISLLLAVQKLHPEIGIKYKKFEVNHKPSSTASSQKVNKKARDPGV